MKILYKPIGFDIRKPGVVSGGVQNYDAIAAPFKPRTKPWITIDKYVNPSVFIHINQLDIAKTTLKTDHIVIYQGANQGFDLFMLWDDLMDMMVNYPRDANAADAAFAYAWVDLSNYGISTLADDTFEVLTNRRITPSSIPEKSILLGYDIISPYFISVLSGYNHSQTQSEFVSNINSNINSVGLISATATIANLVKISKAVQEEILEDPFFMVGIFLLWDNSGFSLVNRVL
ncbi:hypothetical protein MHK_002193 [Candidatus Magnetomorum sp. HK-1]|nr:hypothetical protein MHK_002193 [Candidatus Magnetomorum sp. HK-1]